MKKILGIFLFICIAFKGIAQSGDGSSGNPFYGTISTNVIWSVGNFAGATVYVGTTTNPDLTVNTGGHLTIDPGITVIFTQLTSDLIITGSGVLTSEGTITNNIHFTKSSSISHWGHISFETPGTTTPIAGTGSFKFCKVEYGYVNGVYPYPNSAGGAIQINANNVIIENSYFNNNYATFGGGVVVNESRNAIIRNCYFKSNSANECAGGLLLHLNCRATVENCIFESNYCAGATQAYYGGGAMWIRQNTSTIANCTFINNTSPRAGDGLYSFQSPGSKIINSIFWGSNDQFATNGTAATLAYCAFSTVKPPTSLNSIILNSNNSDPAGPNFIAIDGSDWSIKYISPCKDAGTNSYPGVTIPPTDYAGRPTIGNKDIGAYEVAYSLWTGAASTLWSAPANWMANVDPATGTGDVIIPSGLTNYPTGSSPDFTVKTGRIMQIQPGAKVTLGNLINNGSLSLQSDATNLSSLLISSYSGNDAVIGLFLSGGLAGGPKTEKWHYVSSPVSALPVSTFAPGFTLNVAGWYDDRVTTTLAQGWVAYDGYVYATGNLDGPTFSSLTPGKGYDYYDSADDQYTFSGQFNTSDVAVSLTYNTVDSLLHGFNLLGNPFSAGLNWDDIVNSGSYPAKTRKSISYTRDNTECTYVAGVGVPGDVTGIIPPMQGFFIRTHSVGNTITLAASARTHAGGHLTYKKLEAKGLQQTSKTLESIPLVRLAFAEGIASDETVIRFDNNASTNLDDDFDGIKMFISTTNTQIYSLLGGVNYAINGQPFPIDSIEIPIVVNLIVAGDHNLSATQIVGLENYNLFLLDKTAGTVTNLKSNPVVSFSSAAGKFTTRFAVKIVKPVAISGGGGDPIPPVVPPDTTQVGTDPGSGGDTIPVLTAIIDRTYLKGTFNIYPSYEFINIQTLSEDWDGLSGSVRVLDLMGKPVSDLQNAEFRRGEVITVQAPVTRGVYLVEIKSGVKRFVGKVVIR